MNTTTDIFIYSHSKSMDTRTYIGTGTVVGEWSGSLAGWHSVEAVMSKSRVGSARGVGESLTVEVWVGNDRRDEHRALMGVHGPVLAGIAKTVESRYYDWINLDYCRAKMQSETDVYSLEARDVSCAETEDAWRKFIETVPLSGWLAPYAGGEYFPTTQRPQLSQASLEPMAW